MRRLSFATVVEPIQRYITPRSLQTTLAQHDSLFSFEPDFLLHVPQFLPSYHRGKDSPETALVADPLHALPFVTQMMTYSGHRTDIEACITGILMATPGMLLVRYVLICDSFRSYPIF